MQSDREEYECISELFDRFSKSYGYEFSKNDKSKSVSITVRDSGHELQFSYVFGNNRVFVVDEWDPMSTIGTTNLQYLPSDISYKIAKWKKSISEKG